ncbi:MAG: hypothetical protein FWD15_00510 [Alphaproteobacteria bacterium]|nr:hypothetical protein [Alphaproteobacteria bacterium]
MDKKKISDFIDAYCDIVKPPKGKVDYNSILKELIANLVRHYSSQGITHVSVKEDDFAYYIIKPVNGKYALEDFFLNRLFFNVRAVGEDGTDAKGQYVPEELTVLLNLDNIDNQFKRQPLLLTRATKPVRDIAKKKVIMHEFEHGIQSRFSLRKIEDETDSVYFKAAKRVSEMGGGKYKGIINSPSNIKKVGRFLNSRFINVGLYVPHFSPLAKAAFRKTNGGIKAHIDMNEIFNESESLVMAGAGVQLRRRFDSGNYLNICNNESSNEAITTFGFMLKEVMGARVAFDIMYLDPTEKMAWFNKKFGDIFAASYDKKKTAWENLQAALAKIKTGRAEGDYLVLNAVLAKCLERRVNHQIGKVESSELLESVKAFRKYTVDNADPAKRKVLEHFKILQSLYFKLGGGMVRPVSAAPLPLKRLSSVKSGGGRA